MAKKKTTKIISKKKEIKKSFKLDKDEYIIKIDLDKKVDDKKFAKNIELDLYKLLPWASRIDYKKPSVNKFIKLLKENAKHFRKNVDMFTIGLKRLRFDNGEIKNLWVQDGKIIVDMQDLHWQSIIYVDSISDIFFNEYDNMVIAVESEKYKNDYRYYEFHSKNQRFNLRKTFSS